MEYKIGIGYDIHRLTEGRRLFLGGVEIPYIKGLFGHSDADVLLHAVCDALLGAMGEEDIGEHFPDTDPKYLNINSSQLLKMVSRLVREKSFQVANIDTVVIAEEPKLTPFKKQIQERIADMLGIDKNCVGIKAKTNEGLGAVGSKEAIAVYATVLLSKGD